MSRERVGNFSSFVRDQVIRDQRHKCAVTGKNTYLEIHHEAPLHMTFQQFPDLDPAILSQRANAIGINPDDHKRIHHEIDNWPEEFKVLFITGMVEYLTEEYEKQQAKTEHLKVIMGSGGNRRIG